MLCHLALGILVVVDVVVIKIVPCEGNHEPWRRRVRRVVRRRRRSCRRRGRVHGESPLPPEGDAGTVLVEDVQADEQVHPLCQAIPFQDGERGTGQGDRRSFAFPQDEGGTSGGETAQDAARTDAGGPSRVAPIQEMEQPGPLGRLGGQDGDLGAGIDEGSEGGRWVVWVVVMMVMVSLADTGRIATPGVMVVRANGDTAGNS